MKRFIQKLMLAATVLCLGIAMAVPTAFAADTTYVLSFRPGAYGSFSGGAAAYLSNYGTVEQSAAGNLFLQVAAGTALPSDLETQLRSYLQPDSGYYYRSGLSASGAANEDATYVADYGVLQGGGYAYTVRYVDAVSGTELSESYTGYANAGDQVVFQAKVLAGYAVDQAEKSLTIQNAADQVIEFRYTSTAEAGEDIVQTNTVTIPGGVATAPTDGADAAGADAAGTVPADEGTVPEGETISDNTTPEADGAGIGDENIGDNDTPRADTLPNEGGSPSATTVLIAAVGTGCAIVLVVLLIFALRRKKSEQN